MKDKLFDLIYLLLIFSVATPIAPDPETSCGFVQNQRGQRISIAGEIEFYFHKDFPQEYKEDVKRSIRLWNEFLPEDKQLRINLTKTNTSKSPIKDGVSVIYWLDTWDKEKPSEQARATVYWVGDKIYESDIRINRKNFKFSKNPQFGRVHFFSLITHEIGHALGLGHNDKEYHSVMYPTLANGQLRDRINRKDLENLSCEYFDGEMDLASRISKFDNQKE